MKESNAEKVRGFVAVYIEWFDSLGCSLNWETIEENLELNPIICKTLGFLIKESEEYILVIPHLVELEHQKQGCGDMIIYKKQIKKIQEITL